MKSRHFSIVQEPIASPNLRLVSVFLTSIAPVKVGVGRFEKDTVVMNLGLIRVRVEVEVETAVVILDVDVVRAGDGI